MGLGYQPTAANDADAPCLLFFGGDDEARGDEGGEEVAHVFGRFQPQVGNDLPIGRAVAVVEFFEFDDRMNNPLLQSDERYESLAESLISELIDENSGYKPKTSRRKYADDVNKALANHLFLEQGYRLDYDFRLLMTKNNTNLAQYLILR